MVFHHSQNDGWTKWPPVELSPNFISYLSPTLRVPTTTTDFFYFQMEGLFAVQTHCIRQKARGVYFTPILTISLTIIFFFNENLRYWYTWPFIADRAFLWHNVGEIIRKYSVIVYFIYYKVSMAPNCV